MHRTLGLAGAAGAVLVLLCAGHAQAGFKSLYSFQGGNDGIYPGGDLIRDTAGNLFGTTNAGGGSGCGGMGCGLVLKLTASGQESVLYAFRGGGDGWYPQPGLYQDKSGNLYGTTAYGGGSGCGGSGCGTLFQISPDGTETVLHTFSGGSDGAYPNGQLISDKSGNLYGTTNQGGTGNYGHGFGTAFKLGSNGTLTTLYSFTAGDDSAFPAAGLVRQSGGNLYGTTENGGPYGAGTIFKLASGGAESVLYAFDDVYDGEFGNPVVSVTLDSSGDIFTPVEFGPYGCDVIFELAADGTPSVLYAFTGGNDGCVAYGNLLRDASGNLYGTTEFAGAKGDGTVYRIAPDGTETTLHAFAGTDGNSPSGGLVADKKLSLYGTTILGGSAGDGNVFRVTQ